ncbi:MAG: hypothetical protein R3A46_10015 [Thermomicrobiales bacterium]
MPTAGAIQVLVTDAIAPAIRNSHNADTPDIIRTRPVEEGDQSEDEDDAG